MVVFHTWSGRGPRSRKLTQISKWIFQLLVDRNLSLEMSFVPSHLNRADWFSRRLSRSDAMLSPKLGKSSSVGLEELTAMIWI